MANQVLPEHREFQLRILFELDQASIAVQQDQNIVSGLMQEHTRRMEELVRHGVALKKRSMQLYSERAPIACRGAFLAKIPPKLIGIIAKVFAACIYGLALLFSLGQSEGLRSNFKESVQGVKKFTQEICYALYAAISPNKGIDKYFALQPVEIGERYV